MAVHLLSFQGLPFLPATVFQVIGYLSGDQFCLAQGAYGDCEIMVAC